MQAAAWLVNTSALYQEQGITLDENWMTSIESETDSGVHNNENSNGSDDRTIPEDEWSENEAEIPAGVTDSILTVLILSMIMKDKAYITLALQKVIDH